MARQESVIQLTGTVGNIIFYKSIDGYLARQKGGIDARRIHSEPAFARTRENNAEFRRAAQATRLIRAAFASLLQGTADTRMTGRLNGAMVKVIQADAVNKKGERNVVDGDLSLLQGFDFNKNARLASTFRAPFTTAIDRSAGTFTVNAATLTPSMIHAPEGATHFRLKASGAAIDFMQQRPMATTSETAALSLADSHGPLELNIAITPDNSNPLVLLVGIEFMQVLHGVEYSMADSAYNAMGVVKVERATRSN